MTDNYILSNISQAEIDALVQNAIDNNNLNQAPKFATEPTTLNVGDKYYNTTDNKEYLLTPTGFVVIDIVGDLEIQDLAGNTLALD